MFHPVFLCCCLCFLRQIVNKLSFIPPAIFPHLLVGFAILALRLPSGSPCSSAVDLVPLAFS